MDVPGKEGLDFEGIGKGLGWLLAGAGAMMIAVIRFLIPMIKGKPLPVKATERQIQEATDRVVEQLRERPLVITAITHVAPEALIRQVEATEDRLEEIERRRGKEGEALDKRMDKQDRVLEEIRLSSQATREHLAGLAATVKAIAEK